MTLAEFKAWFDGYTEEIDGAPTAEQFKRIKARVAEINGKAITKETIERHVTVVQDYWPAPRPYRYRHGTTCQNIANSASMMALNDLGRAEFASLAAS